MIYWPDIEFSRFRVKVEEHRIVLKDENVHWPLFIVVTALACAIGAAAGVDPNTPHGVVDPLLVVSFLAWCAGFVAAFHYSFDRSLLVSKTFPRIRRSIELLESGTDGVSAIIIDGHHYERVDIRGIYGLRGYLLPEFRRLINAPNLPSAGIEPVLVVRDRIYRVFLAMDDRGVPIALASALAGRKVDVEEFPSVEFDPDGALSYDQFRAPVLPWLGFFAVGTFILVFRPHHYTTLRATIIASACTLIGMEVVARRLARLRDRRIAETLSKIWGTPPDEASPYRS